MHLPEGEPEYCGGGNCADACLARSLALCASMYISCIFVVTLLFFFTTKFMFLDLIQCICVCACMCVYVRLYGLSAPMCLCIQDMHLCVYAPMRLCAYGSVRLSVYLAFLNLP